jgi:hypothetical protein
MHETMLCLLLFSLNIFQVKVHSSVRGMVWDKQILLDPRRNILSEEHQKAERKIQGSKIVGIVALRGGSPRYQEGVETVPETEWRGLFGLGRTDASGEPLPSESPLHEEGPDIEIDGEDDYSEEDGIEDKGLPLSLLDYEVIL